MSTVLETLGNLDERMTGRSGDERAAILRAVTDLFLGNANRMTPAAVDVFDEVLTRLSAHIEARALAELSRHIAPVPTAPPRLVRRLAFDDDIEVARPVLEQSERLDTDALTTIASTKSQTHLAAIAIRPSVEVPVSDILVERGDTGVAVAIAGNGGARFSDTGFSRLVTRAESEEGIAELVASRDDITADHLRLLVQRATSTIRRRLMARIVPEARAKLDVVLTDIAADIDRSTAKRQPRNYAAAEEFAASLPNDPVLLRARLFEFAQSGAVEHAIALLARLCEMPVAAVERVLINGDHGGSFIMLRAIEIDWPAACMVLALRTHLGRPRFVRTESMAQQFRQLNVRTARKVLQFWQARAAGEATAPVATPPAGRQRSA